MQALSALARKFARCSIQPAYKNFVCQPLNAKGESYEPSTPTLRRDDAGLCPDGRGLRGRYTLWSDRPATATAARDSPSLRRYKLWSHRDSSDALGKRVVSALTTLQKRKPRDRAGLSLVWLSLLCRQLPELRL